MTDMVIAGGSVVKALRMGDPTDEEVQLEARQGTSDIDIFCTAEDPATAMATFQRLLAHVKSRLVEVVDESAQSHPDVEDWEKRSQVVVSSAHHRRHSTDPPRCDFPGCSPNFFARRTG